MTQVIAEYPDHDADLRSPVSIEFGHAADNRSGLIRLKKVEDEAAGRVMADDDPKVVTVTQETEGNAALINSLMKYYPGHVEWVEALSPQARELYSKIALQCSDLSTMLDLASTGKTVTLSEIKALMNEMMNQISSFHQYENIFERDRSGELEKLLNFLYSYWLYFDRNFLSGDNGDIAAEKFSSCVKIMTRRFSPFIAPLAITYVNSMTRKSGKDKGVEAGKSLGQVADYHNAPESTIGAELERHIGLRERIASLNNPEMKSLMGTICCKLLAIQEDYRHALNNFAVAQGEDNNLTRTYLPGLVFPMHRLQTEIVKCIIAISANPNSERLLKGLVESLKQVYHREIADPLAKMQAADIGKSISAREPELLDIEQALRGSEYIMIILQAAIAQSLEVDQQALFPHNEAYLQRMWEFQGELGNLSSLLSIPGLFQKNDQGANLINVQPEVLSLLRNILDEIKQFQVEQNNRMHEKTMVGILSMQLLVRLHRFTQTLETITTVTQDQIKDFVLEVSDLAMIIQIECKKMQNIIGKPASVPVNNSAGEQADRHDSGVSLDDRIANFLEGL